LSYQICLLILENYKYELQKIREQIINNRKILLNILTNKNLQAFDSEGNFILVNLKSEKEKEKVRMALSKNRLLVRDFNKNTMLNTCLRITIPEGKEFNKVANFFHYNI
jgi:histidinol-phosphate/aromatic aminotransferase/cobyric acid decarboxylase-like protein